MQTFISLEKSLDGHAKVRITSSYLKIVNCR